MRFQFKMVRNSGFPAIISVFYDQSINLSVVVPSCEERSASSGSVKVLLAGRMVSPTVSQIHFSRSADNVSDTHQPCPSVEGGHPLSGSVLPDTRRPCYPSENTLSGSRPVFRDSPPGPDPRSSEASVVGEDDPTVELSSISARNPLCLGISNFDSTLFYVDYGCAGCRLQID